MKVYGDLFVRGGAEVLKRFIVELDQRLSNAAGWSRNQAREAQMARHRIGPVYCFACTARDARPASDLFLATHSDGYLYVSNILADGHSSLTYDQYNAILADFFESCAKPAAEAAHAVVELGNPDPQLEDFLSHETAEMLRTFSFAANRSALHPLDRRRWNEFLAAAHRERAELDASTLQRWLIEEERWPEDQAISLALEYEHARGLLETYESLPA